MSADTNEPDRQRRAKRYEAIHNIMFVVETAYTILLLLAFLCWGGSDSLADFARSKSHNPWIYVAVYGAVTVAATKLLFLPLNFFEGFYLEHRFELSNETFGAWALDELKSLGLNLALGVLILDVVYFLLRHAGDWWWVGAGGFFLLFGVVMSALFPVLILPLFYKLQPLENESLRLKLTALAQRVGAKVLGVYRMDMSEKTKKANAAFAGLGRTKRIILGDTLLDKFAEDEIEVVMAHEMAHYKHGDITRMILWGAITTFVGLKVADVGLHWGMTHVFQFNHLWDIEAFPLLALCLFVFGLVVTPLNNAFSRSREWKADATALELTANRDAFIRAMRKLAEQNLADLSPHPAVEFLLHDHPSLARRIAWAERWQGT
ncbi:MAG TPA: M48 family metallopeptidase [Verrucomicrobiae bacterium]|nr:M48 family metallopeptidase [Verrucomicrobiae bacterium]